MCLITDHIPQENQIITVSIINTLNGIHFIKKKKHNAIIVTIATIIANFFFLKLRDSAPHIIYAIPTHKLIYPAIISKLTPPHFRCDRKKYCSIPSIMLRINDITKNNIIFFFIFIFSFL